MRAFNRGLRARPDYGGWPIVGVAFLSAAFTIGSSTYAFGLFIEPLASPPEAGGLGWSRIAITASLSFAAVGSVAAPVIGRLVDRFGARPIMTASLIMIGTSLLLRPLMTELWQWYALSFLQFLPFWGATSLPAGRLVGIWFSETRGRVMGMTLMGNNFGGITIPIVTGLALATASWKEAYIVLGAIGIVVAVLTLPVVHERPGQHRSSSIQVGPPAADWALAAEPALSGWTVSEALRARTFYMITLAIMLASFTHWTVLPLVGDHLANGGMSRSSAALGLSLLAGCWMMGKLLFGYLAERVTARRAMMVSLGGQIPFILLMSVYPSPPGVWVWVAMFGLFMGAYGPLVTLIIQENFGLKYYGSISGLVGMATVVPFAIGPLIAGASFDIADSYGPAFVMVAAMFAIGIGLLMQARQPVRLE